MLAEPTCPGAGAVGMVAGMIPTSAGCEEGSSRVFLKELAKPVWLLCCRRASWTSMCGFDVLVAQPSEP